MGDRAKPSWCDLLAWLGHQPYVCWTASFLSFIALAAVAFFQYSRALFYRFDGRFILTHATTQARWMAPGFELSANFLEGISDLWFPIATKWSLGLSVGGLFDQKLMPVVACVIFAAELFLSTLVLARCIGAGFVTGLAAAWLGALFTLPLPCLRSSAARRPSRRTPARNVAARSSLRQSSRSFSCQPSLPTKSRSSLTR